MLIARLIADPAILETRLDAMTAQLADGAVPVANAVMREFCGDVLQIESPGTDMVAFRAALDAHFPESDAIVASGPFAFPRVFVSDMDSTMIGQECIDELADFAGLKEKVADITERAMQGELDFASALRERVGLLAGLAESAIDQCLAERIRPTPGAQVLVETLKAKGCRTVLVTGGFHHFADRVAGQLGFERVVGNRLDVTDGKLTGGLVGAIVDSATKEAVLREEVAVLGENAVSMAAGDGANDIPMLQASSYGIAYRAKPKARAAANGWVDRGDLTSLLKLLDIPEKDWVA
ncbi:Phosphoserine phosphatase [Erythrobacter sp. EC-HK427]|nr:Phosphoserine phosphatase [Erythrobacter sp. EC-HK427]